MFRWLLNREYMCKKIQKRISLNIILCISRVFYECFRDSKSTSSEGEHDDDDIDKQQLNTIKTDFTGLNIKEPVPVDQEKSYFKIKINDTDKFLHKSTACYLRTKDNNSLSADRLSRVTQTYKKWIIFSFVLYTIRLSIWNTLVSLQPFFLLLLLQTWRTRKKVRKDLRQAF